MSILFVVPAPVNPARRVPAPDRRIACYTTAAAGSGPRRGPRRPSPIDRLADLAAEESAAMDMIESGFAP